MFEHEGDLSSKISKMGIIKLNKVKFSLISVYLLVCLFGGRWKLRKLALAAKTSESLIWQPSNTADKITCLIILCIS